MGIIMIKMREADIKFNKNKIKNKKKYLRGLL